MCVVITSLRHPQVLLEQVLLTVVIVRVPALGLTSLGRELVIRITTLLIYQLGHIILVQVVVRVTIRHPCTNY